LEQVSFHKGKISEAVVRGLTSQSDDSLLDSFFEHLAKKDAKKSLAMIEDFVKEGKDIKTFLSDCLGRLHTELMNGKSESKELIRRFTEAYAMMKTSPIPQLPMELAVVEYCDVGLSFPRTREPALSDEKKADPRVEPEDDKTVIEQTESYGLLTQEKLVEHWKDFIEELKPFNHSVAGVLRSARPKSVVRGIVTIEAFYPFHKDKLSESKTKDVLIQTLKKLFGEKVKIEIVLGKK